MAATPIPVYHLGPALPDLSTSAFGPFVLHHCASLQALAEQLAMRGNDEATTGAAVLVPLAAVGGLDRLVQWPGLAQACLSAAVLAVTPEPSVGSCMKLLQAGVREVLDERELKAGEALGRSLRLALERKKQDDVARRAYSIDLATGLPNQHQLLEHMTHLLALREREPASMALIALQLDGLAAAEAGLGAEAANVLRRKAAVRLRASLRASDVVASLGGDMFAVLLAWIDAEDDAERVARKLLSSVSQPFQVTGHSVPLGARVGVGQYPAHGKEAQALLNRALSQAAGGSISRLLGRAAAAANDDEGQPQLPL